MGYNLPVYIKQFDFGEPELDKLLREDSLNNDVDELGNIKIKINSTSIKNTGDINNEIMLFTESKTKYSNDLIDQYYETEFTEFAEFTNKLEPTDLGNANNNIENIVDEQLRRESILETQINELTKVLDLETQKNISFKENSEQNYNASKQTIIELRIKNGEGDSVDDFEDVFPFPPKKILSEERIGNESTQFISPPS